MSNTPDPERLQRLEKRIVAAKGTEKPVSKVAQNANQAHMAWRMVLELVVGLLLGFGIGYGIDHWLSSAPWAMIIMGGFGFAAGIKTMMRTAQEVRDKHQSDQSGSR